MNGRKVLLVLVSTVMLSAMVAVSSAQERTVGVVDGDWFRFVEVVDWSSNDPDAFPPPLTNETEWFLMSVEDVSGTNITFLTVTHYRNGSDMIEGAYVDVAAGIEENATLMAISANLGDNDSIYSSEIYSTWKLGETLFRTYLDSVRETNHVNITSGFSEGGQDHRRSMEYYWDRKTGILVEASVIYETRRGDYVTTLSMSYRVADSNVWVIPEFPTLTSILLSLAALTVAIAICKTRQHETQNTNHC